MTEQVSSKSRKTKPFDYRGALIQGAIVVSQGALWGLGSTLATRFAAPKMKGAPDLTVVGKEDAPLAIRKTVGHA